MDEITETKKDQYKVNLAGFLGNVNKKHLLILFLIFVLGFCIRAHLMQFEYFFGFDSYFHARIAGYVAETGVIPDMDPLAYYYMGGSTVGPITPVFWYLTAAIYWAFTLFAPFDKAVWILFVKLLPAIFGGLICVAMYYFVGEMYGKKAGYIAGFFSAVVPSFVYRTMAGFFEEDSLGFLWMVLGFYFFVKAVKPMEFNKETIKNGIIAAVFFGIMAWTWEMFLLVPIVLVAYFLFTAAILWFKSVEKKKIFAMAKIFLLCMVLFGGFASLKHGTVWIERSVDYVAQYLPISPENIERGQARGEGILAQTVGEENTGYQFFMLKYNALIIFPIAALFLIPYRILRKKQDHLSLLLFFYIIVTLFMAWSKLKFTYTFGLPVAAAAGFVAAELFVFIKQRTGFEKKLVAGAFAFMMLVGLGAATHFVTERPPSIETTYGWKQALEWMQAESPKDAKFFNWWNQGHWITFIGERKTLIDNRNADIYADSNFGRFAIQEDEETAYEIVKAYGADHVILSEDLLSSLGSMAVYAYLSWDPSDFRLQKYAGNRGFAGWNNCNREVDGFTGQESIVCGSNRFTEAQFAVIPDTYTKNPSQFLDPTVPLFVYRARDGSKIYFVSGVVNNSMVARLWFNDPLLQHFTEVKGVGAVKIFKVLE